MVSNNSDPGSSSAPTQQANSTAAKAAKAAAKKKYRTNLKTDAIVLADLGLMVFWAFGGHMTLLNGEVPKGACGHRLFRKATGTIKQEVNSTLKNLLPRSADAALRLVIAGRLHQGNFCTSHQPQGFPMSPLLDKPPTIHNICQRIDHHQVGMDGSLNQVQAPTPGSLYSRPRLPWVTNGGEARV